MNLRQIVQKYQELAGGFGKPVALVSFGLDATQLERAFSVLDEDYHISRFFHFSSQPGAPAYRINGFEHTHVAIDAEVESIL